MALIGANEMLAEDDLEKLKPTDFIIDLAQQDEWRAEGTARVEALHKSIVAENLANELVTSRMRDEFWNAMEAPAVTLHGLPVPGQGAPNRQNLQKVVSYTVAKPLEASQARLATVKLLRRVEVNLDVWEAKDSGEEAPNYRPSSSFEDAAGFAHDVAKVITAAEARAAEMAKAAEGGDKKDGDKKDGDKKAEGEEGEAAEDGEEEGKKADVKLLYQPFELHTKWRKISQMSMHGQEVQSKLKRDFNDKLKSMVNYKRAELEKIKERQTRIHEIEDELSRLGSASDGEPTLEMGMHPDEEPEKLLEVSEDEIRRRSGSRPPSANGWPRLEEEKRLRDEANRGDNLGQRGLVAMMNGTLETRKEEDAIFTDLVMPEWMSEKPEDELTDDDRAAIKEFQDAQKKLQAERDKRSKGLLTELAKLRLEIQDICNNFNERVKALKETKIQFDSALYESELIVIRLAQARLQFEAFERHSAELTKELAEQASVAADARSKLAIFNVELNKQAELVERSAPRTGRWKRLQKDFAEVPDFFEALSKLFKRRETIKVPLGTKDGSKKDKKVKAQAPRPGGALLIAAQGRPADSGDDGGGDRRRRRGGGGGATLWPISMSRRWRTWWRRSTPPSTCPRASRSTCGTSSSRRATPSCARRTSWRRRPKRSRQCRSTSRCSPRTTTGCAAHPGAGVDAGRAQGAAAARRVEPRAALQAEAGAGRGRGGRRRHRLWRRIAAAPDGGDLAQPEIRKLGAEKVIILKEIRDFRKGIVQAEWENARADMEAEDLVERTKEFQLLRVTKDLQDKIRGGGEDNHAGGGRRAREEARAAQGVARGQGRRPAPASCQDQRHDCRPQQRDGLSAGADRAARGLGPGTRDDPRDPISELGRIQGRLQEV